ncbi:hypothetical protein HIM_08033 [Hirsutella minnesotensis 3608]|uniref:Histidine-specific methyltransferase SAM-dependent domain-containing protein n=1 Tax=Hirsutella minnesotensis 3608 TaxID=1043627 RepID=A0A0F8A3V9_9HYPO|nr:hypothetical protein HIM_08033 [Hirsutella minnesotensis 3608]
MASTPAQGDEITSIFDIRRDVFSFDLAAEICQSLKAPSLSLPSLLLWDDRGQQLFDEFSQVPAYYPFHAEIEILNRHGAEICRIVPPGGVLLELGCGAIRKTKSILFNFHQQRKRVHYIALDVSPQGLNTSLSQLKSIFKDSPYISITGLIGTYDDCVTWLRGLKHHDELNSVTIMWLGNSIANLDSKEEASNFLHRFRSACESSGLDCQFIVSTDICQRINKVLDAYDLKRSTPREFFLNAARAANLALGYDVLPADSWEPVACLDEHQGAVVFYLEATRNVHIVLPRAERVLVARGDRIRLVSSGKWDEVSVDGLCAWAGFRVQQRWKDTSGDYCIFMLKK